MSDSGPKRCELCGRVVSQLTKHHLIPRTRHRKKRTKRVFSRREVQGRVAWLCRACHSNLHATLSEKALEQEYNTLGSLAAHPEIARFTAWVRKQRPGLRVRVRRRRG